MVYTLRFFFSLKFSLFHNSNLFGSCIIHILYTECAKIKKIIPAPKGLMAGNSKGLERKFSCPVSRCGVMNATQTQSCKQKPKLWLQNGVETELSCLRRRKT